MTDSRKATRVLIAGITVVALALVLLAASPVQAAGLTNCVDLTGRRGACYETVWANGIQYRMTFSQEAQQFPGATPKDNADSFYVLAPQTATPQGTLPFLHDHVVGDVPPQNHGDYSVLLQGYFVLCSAAGISSGACVPTMTSIEGFGIIPFARTVNGQPLTSAEAIESAANAGLLTLIQVGGPFVGSINPGR